jgi:hypothetical protein
MAQLEGLVVTVMRMAMLSVQHQAWSQRLDQQVVAIATAASVSTWQLVAERVRQ